MTSDSRAHAALRSFNRFRRDGVAVLAGLACFTIRVCAADVGAPLQAPLKTIVVTSERPPVSVPDTEVKEQLEAAMRSDPFFYDEHITVTIKDGVVTLHGIVFDEWDLRVAKRIARKVPGVKRVINDLEIELGGE